ncbi:DDE endonuclease [Nostoc sp. RF31YmG]|nr:DDE endonuclease [Nostoc sp. RF31YmG]
MCQDESRFGLQTIPGRLITTAGIKPIGSTQWKRDNFFLYGVVEPLTGESFFYEFSHLDSDCFQAFINLVSEMLADSVAVMQMDQASFHRARQIDWPENIIPIFQPAQSPELNPIERFWEYLKAQLQWQNCSTLNQLRDRLTKIIQHLTPECVASLTGWEFITAAVLSSSS